MLRTAGLYIPETMPEVRKDIWDSRIDRATEELGRLAALGSSDAAAVLARMSQCGFEMPGTSEDDIYDSCRAAGQRGNAYAQYVAGVRESREHRWNSAVKWLQMSCDNNFAPACLQCGQIALWVSKKPRVAEKYFLKAMSLGNRAASIAYWGVCASGKLGLVKRIHSTVRFLPSFVAFFICTLRNPFDVRVTCDSYPLGLPAERKGERNPPPSP